MAFASKALLFLSALYIKARMALLLFATLFATANTYAQSTEQSVALGSLDTFSISGNEFLAQGWVAPVNPIRKITAIIIKVGDTTIYEGGFEKFERPDVAATMARKDWLNSGWRVGSALPSSLKVGKYAVAAKAKMEDGELIELSVNDHTSMIEINPDEHARIMIVLGLLGFAISLVVAALIFAEKAARKLSKQLKCHIHPIAIPTFALIFLFACLVGMGTSGSSFQIGSEQSSTFVSADGFYPIWGTPRPIRTDEWLVFTPLAISQANHSPAFPVINQNIGEEGQNMLVVGFTGMPVNHISAFAKPATWGFHFFDLRRALAWYWWFPIFGCLFALWSVFSLISPNHWRIGFLLSLSFCASAYVTAWSYWPAYAVFFPSLMLCSSIAILHNRNAVALFVLAMALGLSLAGFVLLLYPPWQISLGYLFLFIGIGIVLRDKLYKKFNPFNLLSFAFALGLAILILWNWWSDADSAIIAMMNTVYPGHRDSLTGGSFTVSYLLRGFTNLITIYRMDGGYSNQTEIASFYFMFPALFVLFCVRLWSKKIGIIHCLLLLFIAFTVTYMLVGLPKDFTKLTLWGRVPDSRADLSLGLAYMLLIGALLVPNTTTSRLYKIPIIVFAGIASVAWGVVVVYAISKIPPETLSGFTPSILVAIFLVILFGSWWLAIGEYRKYLVLNLMLSIVTVLPFNPLIIFPHTVAPVADFSKNRFRVLVASTYTPAMLLLASGQPVSNGILYYPQKRMWERLDPNGSQENIYNRYQHLVFTLSTVATPYYRIETPQGDVVKVTVDPTHFDFRKTGASIFVAPSTDLNALKLNQSLKFVSENNGWSRFVISRLENE
ncbi:MAG: DUF7657 domain-containing protein [Methylobacter sp.]